MRFTAARTCIGSYIGASESADHQRAGIDPTVRKSLHAS